MKWQLSQAALRPVRARLILAVIPSVLVAVSWASRIAYGQTSPTTSYTNYALVGDANAIGPDDLDVGIRGFVEAPGAFESLMRSMHATEWPRVNLLQDTTPAATPQRSCGVSPTIT